MIKLRFLFFELVFTASTIIPAFAQTKSDSTDFRYNFNVEAQDYYKYTQKTEQYNYYSVHNDVVSNIWGRPEKPKYNFVTDNPFHHNAFYALVKSETSYKKKYFLLLDILMEHRGMSYGVEDMNNIVVLPIYRFEFHENYRFLNDTLNIKFQIGCFNHNRLQSGLKIYNLDTQGANIEFDWKNFNIQFYDIGDLSFGTGIGLEEFLDLSISYKKTFKSGEYFKFGLNCAKNSCVFSKDYFILYKNISEYFSFGAFGEYSISKNSRLYYQCDLRNAPYLNFKENSALLIGAEFNKKYCQIQISLNPEIRYYGWMYNYGHKNDSVNYRFKDKPIYDSSGYNLYSKTVGRYLYPLMNYNNQFSQWAVYTDYQYQNIAGLELRTKIEWFFLKKLSFKVDIETCTLLKEYDTNGKNYFTYLFYTNSLIYNIANNFNIRFEIGNKAINLDKHYQTFYMSKIPFIGFCIRKELE